MAMLNQSGEDLVKVQDVSSVFAERCAARNGWVRSMKRNWPIQAGTDFLAAFLASLLQQGKKGRFLWYNTIIYAGICTWANMAMDMSSHVNANT